MDEKIVYNLQDYINFTLIEDYGYEYINNGRNFFFKFNFDLSLKDLPLDIFDIKLFTNFIKNDEVFTEETTIDLLNNYQYNLDTATYLISLNDTIDSRVKIAGLRIVANVKKEKLVDFGKYLFDITTTPEILQNTIQIESYESEHKISEDVAYLKGQIIRKVPTVSLEERPKEVPNLQIPQNNIVKKIQDYYLSKKEDKYFLPLLLSRNYDNKGVYGFIYFNIFKFTQNFLQQNLQFLKEYQPEISYSFKYRFVNGVSKPIDYINYPVNFVEVKDTLNKDIKLLTFRHNNIPLNSYNFQYGIEIKSDNGKLVDAIRNDLNGLKEINFYNISDENIDLVNNIITAYNLDVDAKDTINKFKSNLSDLSGDERIYFLNDSLYIKEYINNTINSVQEIFDFILANEIQTYEKWFSEIYKNEKNIDTGFRVFSNSFNETFRESRSRMYNTLKIDFNVASTENRYLLVNDIIIKNKAVYGNFFDPRLIYAYNKETQSNFSNAGTIEDSVLFDNNIYLSNKLVNSADKKRFENFIFDSKDYQSVEKKLQEDSTSITANIVNQIANAFNKEPSLITINNTSGNREDINLIKLKEVYLTNLFEIFVVSDNGISVRVTLQEAKRLINENLTRNIPTLFKLVEYKDNTQDADILPNDSLSLPIFDQYFLIESRQSLEEPTIVSLPPSKVNFDNNVSKIPEDIKKPKAASQANIDSGINNVRPPAGLPPPKSSRPSNSQQTNTSGNKVIKKLK